MNRIVARFPSKRVVPVQAVLLLLLVGTIQPETAGSAPVLAVWIFKNNGISKADTREYIDSLIYSLERKGLFRIVEAGDCILDFIPEVSLFGVISKGNGYYGVNLRIENNYSAETFYIVSKIYPTFSALFKDSRRLVDEIVVQYNTIGKFLNTEETQHSYVVQGGLYHDQFSDYMDLVRNIEARPAISEELEKAIQVYRLRRLSYGFSVLIEGIEKFAVFLGGNGYGGHAGNVV